MKKLVLAGFSLLAVGLLVLGSQTNVVGYQTVQTSQQNVIKERINQKELLIQTICDLANNKDIQNAIIASQPGFFTPNTISLPIKIPTVTKRQMEFVYRIGSLLSRTNSQLQVHLLDKENHRYNHVLKEKISAIIEKDGRLKSEVMQLSNLSCNCGLTNFSWNFPVLCVICICIVLGIELIMNFIPYLDIVMLFFIIIGGIAFVFVNSYCLWIVPSTREI